MTRFPLPLAVPALALCAASAVTAQTEPVTPRTMIVMDGSGSMWGQIGGTPKLEIARDVVAEVLAGLAPDTALGLIAYGHRRRGDCGDIELMVAPAPGSAPQVAQAVGAMRFQGRTPLTEAVRRAAEALRHTEDPATVILVTDGIETCEADPCALARELEASGVNFTAHVVGFGLSADEGAQVACLAEETGGRYIQADDAAQLTEALTQTLAAAPEPQPEPEPDPLPATDQAGGPWYPGAERMANLQIMPTGRQILAEAPRVSEITFPADGTPELCAALCADDTACTAWQFDPPGSYFIAEARCHLFDAAAEFDYNDAEEFVAGFRAGAEQLVRPYDPLPPARLTAPATAAAVAVIEVGFEGPGNAADYIDIVEEGATRTHRPQSYAMVVDGNPARLTVPAAPGAYQIRYVEERDGAERRILASVPLVVGEVLYALDAAETVMAGDAVAVRWQGPAAEGAYLDLIEAGADRTHAAQADAYVTEGNPLTLFAPLEPGAYELRYIVEGPEGRVVGLRRPITVTPPTGSLTVAGPVQPGATFDVAWSGPASARHWIDVVTPGHAEFSGELTYAYLDPARRAVTLTAPAEPGAYELRFVLEDQRGNRQVLSRIPLAVSATVPAPTAPAKN